MKLENCDIAACGTNNVDSVKFRARMKKVAAPPPPVMKPPLSNGNALAKERNGTHYQQGPPMGPGEESAIDERLEGHMELEVVLPDCKVVKMTVDRRTPMMDLLVQATTSNKIAPGGHIINVVSRDERNVQYKPNTPIGSLDANVVYIVPKSTIDLPVKRMPKLANQPFEQTFRLQVNLPRNQRMVLRVSPRITLSELKHQICAEKEFDLSGHHLVHPAQPDTVLDLNATLDVYGCAEISLMSSSGLRDSIRSTSTNLFAYPRIDEEKKKRGILRLFSRKRKDFQVETPSNGLPLSRSESSSLHRHSSQSKQSLKRKPAPAPPPISRHSPPPLISQSSSSVNSRPESELSGKTDEVESTISHSRHSSDSSGYHEPSVFSDCSENKSPEASIVHGDHGHDSPSRKDSPDVLLKRTSMTDATNLKNVPSCSNVSIVSASRKRKAPLPPPAPPLPAIESPTSPEALPLASGEDVQSSDDLTNQNQKETEAIQYLEEVLQQSEAVKSFAVPRSTMDDSDTDSQKDEEVISVCQAEVHANDTDQEVLRGEDEDTSVQPALAPASASAELPVNEVIDNPAEDSGISTSLNSDADSSIPSINSDFKTAFEYECHEELYCNVTGSEIQSVPSNESPIQSNAIRDETEFIEDESCLDKTVLQECEEDVKTPRLSECNGSPPSSTETSVELDESEVTLNAVQDSPSASPASDAPNPDFAQEPTTEPNFSDQTPPSTEVDAPAPSETANKSPEVSKKEDLPQLSTKSSVSSESPQYSAEVTPQNKRKPVNFALGCYKSESTDIYSLPSPDSETNLPTSTTSQDITSKNYPQAPVRKNKEFPNVKIVPFKNRSEQDDIESVLQDSVRGSVLEKCAHLNNVSTLPLTGRSTSMYNLTPLKKPQVTVSVELDNVEDSSSMKRTQSDQNLLLGMQQKEEFFQEQKRLQEEYQRLQAEFITWQKQLLNNQNLLQSEQIIPQMPFPSFEDIQSKIESLPLSSQPNDVSEPQTIVKQSDIELRTRSLPRPKTKQLSLKEPERPQTPPIPSPVTEAPVTGVDTETGELTTRPESLPSSSVDTQVSTTVEDKVTQVPSPHEKVTSSTQVPSPDSEHTNVPETRDAVTQKPSPDSDSSSSSKSQTLPRPKPKPISALPPSQTMTLNRGSRQKSQAVSVTIGSWQQRGSQTAIADIEPSSVALSRSKFQSLGNIPLTFSKPLSNSMENRKLPPVPSEEATKDASDQKCPPSKPGAERGAIPKEGAAIKKDAGHTNVKEISNDKAVPYIEKASKTRQAEVAAQKQKLERISTSKEATPAKPAKAIVRLSSMKDERELTIRGLRKWPLSDINESSEVVRHTAIEDVRTSSKKPGGYVQEKIRRAEVDLRKPKSTKVEFTTTPKVKETPDKEEKLHITKVDINGPKSEARPKHVNCIPLKATTPVTVSSSSEKWSNTIPKSKSLNTELMSVFSRKSRDTEHKRASITTKEDVLKANSAARQSITVNGSSTQPPPPPPPPPMPSTSTMPTIPPAEQIPVSSRLVMAGGSKTLPAPKKESKRSPTKFSRSKDPREELMLEIRGFGGKKALKKAPNAQPNWHLKVFGPSSTVNS